MRGTPIIAAERNDDNIVVVHDRHGGVTTMLSPLAAEAVYELLDAERNTMPVPAEEEPTELDPETYLFEGTQSEPRQAQARNIDSTWIGLRVRVRTGKTVIIEDRITGVYHFSGITRLYFEDTKALPALFSRDEGYMVDGDEWVTVIP